ncbi:unnamed protein product [Adineta ricciae]|uniref:Uncharacterized protein n=1 Tax=Adineta ricciae TaxID=249248 RepID=A0A814JY88_ADIRI|nr:unnamed protein product [Adineta ricciae]CAF1475039.1 unnamed protein product [Adineta ricciae]
MYETPGETIFSNSEYQCDHTSHSNPNATWSLQDAVASACGQTWDKAQTINKWGCGLDIQLNTWTRKSFRTPYYDQRIEKEKRRIMTDYAVKDCIAVTNLYFIMNPSTTFNTNRYETPVTDEHRMYIHDIVDIRENEDEEILQLLSNPVHHQQKLSIQITAEEMNELNSQPQTPEPQQDPLRPVETEEERKQRKKEKQERKKREIQGEETKPIGFQA